MSIHAFYFYKPIKQRTMTTKKQKYNLYAPQHAWDMNYHLLDDNKKIEYLISIDDITDDENDDGLYIKTLLDLEEIDEILSYVWKKQKYIADTYLKLLSGTKKTITDLLKELVTNK